MDVLLSFAGIAGAAALVQSKLLPSQADFEKAQAKLKTEPEDPQANTTVGKYMAFVLGDYSGAMPFLVKSSDRTLKTLAELELDPAQTDTSIKKVAMGDEWVKAVPRFRALFRIFFDRAAHWYTLAWPGLDGAWKMKSRQQGAKLSAARPQGRPRQGLPAFWAEPTGNDTPAVLDGVFAHTGSYSMKLSPPDPKYRGTTGTLKAKPVPVTGKTMEISAWVRSDGTVDPRDKVFVHVFNDAGVGVGTYGPLVPLDLPFWTRVSHTMKVPEGIRFVQFGAVQWSPKGNIWIDDVSVKFDGKEALTNVSFEER